MAYVTLDSTLIEVGKPTKKEIFDTVRSNQEDHEGRITTLEGAFRKVELWNGPVVNAASASSFTGLDFYDVPFDMTIIEAEIRADEIGALTGNLEMDLKKNSSPNDTGMASIFTTKPLINYATASDYDRSTNQVLGPGATLTAGQTVRLDLTSLPTNGVVGVFYIKVIAEIS